MCTITEWYKRQFYSCERYDNCCRNDKRRFYGVGFAGAQHKARRNCC